MNSFAFDQPIFGPGGIGPGAVINSATLTLNGTDGFIGIGRYVPAADGRLYERPIRTGTIRSLGLACVVLESRISRSEIRLCALKALLKDIKHFVKTSGFDR